MKLDKPGIIWRLTDKPDSPGEVVKKNASHIDEKGHLHSASASMMQNYDKRTPFGCPSKFWFQEVAALPSPQTEAMELGDQCHKEVEHYLLHKQDAFGPIVRPAKPMIDALVAKYPNVQVEQWIPYGFKLEGVNIRGRLDFIGRRENDGLIANITDWKTTSVFDQYAKTPYQLRKDAQMLIYRAAAEKMGCDESLEMSHGYFQTKGPRRAEMVTTTINRAQLSEGLDDIYKTLAAMKNVSAILDSDKVEKDLRKCNAGKKYECPYYAQCQQPQKEKTLMASLFNKFKSAVTPAVTPVVNAAPMSPPIPAPTVTAPSARRLTIQDEAPSVETLQAQIAALQAKQAAENKAMTASVLPPDAPKSVPALAADPVEGFSPVPAPLKVAAPAAAPVVEEKKKGGRPPGAKNKKTTGEPHVETVEEDFEVTEITVSVGATVKAIPNDPKCFEFLRADVTLRAVVRKGADIDAVREKLSTQAEAGIGEDLARMLNKE